MRYFSTFEFRYTEKDVRSIATWKVRRFAPNRICEEPQSFKKSCDQNPCGLLYLVGDSVDGRNPANHLSIEPCK